MAMNTFDRVAVCSRSFSRHPVLRSELLAKYAIVTFNDSGTQLEGDQLEQFLRGHTKAIVGLERMSDEIFSRLPELKVVSKYGVGLDTIDLSSMRKLGKRLGWTGGVNRRSVSELVIAFSIAMLRGLPIAQREVLAGRWTQHVGGLLSGRTIGVVGCGYIGRDLIQLLQPWGCKFLAYDILDHADFYQLHSVIPTTLSTLLSESDIVTLHVPLNESTKGILSASRLRSMKPTAVLINTARGGLVDEQEVKEMLKSNRLSAAAFDVFEAEPPDDIELLELSNFFVTPHIGGSAVEAILAMGRSAIQGLEANYIP